MARHRKRKRKATYNSKAESPELREYQRMASKFPPLAHEEIIALSRRFQKGRDAAVALDERRLVSCILGDDWSDDSIREHKDDIISAYGKEITWLSGALGASEMLSKVLPEDENTPVGLYNHRNDNIFADMPWHEPFAISDVEPEIIDMSQEEFLAGESRFLKDAIDKMEVLVPNTPKDVIDRWKVKKAQLNRRYMITIKELNFSEADMRRMRIWIIDSERALADIVNHNLQLAQSRISKQDEKRRRNVDMSDLIGAANVGLVLGARQFDPEKGKRFSTYAAFHIDGQLYELLNTEDGKSGIKGMSLHEKKQLTMILDANKTFQALFGRDATSHELQSLTGISPEKVRQRLATPQVRTQNIYAPTASGNGDEPRQLLADTLKSDADVEETVARNNYSNMIEAMKGEISGLPEKLKVVLMARTGIVEDDMSQTSREPKTTRKVAGELGLTQQEVNDRYAAALDMLRDRLELKGWSAESILNDD